MHTYKHSHIYIHKYFISYIMITMNVLTFFCLFWMTCIICICKIYTYNNFKQVKVDFGIMIIFEKYLLIQYKNRNVPLNPQRVTHKMKMKCGSNRIRNCIEFHLIRLRIRPSRPLIKSQYTDRNVCTYIIIHTYMKGAKLN